MRLKKITLKNFKALRNDSFEFGEHKTGVRGTNATGKSTLVDAFYWLLYGKDRKGRTDYDVKTRDGDDVLHNLDHVVTGHFVVGERTLCLSRTYREKWTRKRGDANETFTGHETIYSVDETDVKKSEYDAVVEEFFGCYDDFRMLSDPLYFADTLDWKKRRGAVMRIAGSIDNETLINTDPDAFGYLREILTGGDVEVVLADRKAKQNRINSELKEIGVRIDEATEWLKSVRPSDNVDALVTKKNDLEKKIDALADEAAALGVGSDGSAQIRDEISNLSVSLRELQEKRKQRDRLSVEAHEEEKRKAARGIDELGSAILLHQQQIEKIEKELETLRAEYHEIKDSEFDESPNCFNCGQPLPDSTFEKERENWNMNRAKMLKENKEAGAKAAQKLADVQEQKDRDSKRLSVAQKELSNMSPPLCSPETAQEIELKSKIESLRERLENLPATNEDALVALQSRRHAVVAMLSNINEKLSAHQAAEQTKTRLEEHKRKQREVSGAYQLLAHQITLLEKFLIVKLDAIEENVFNTFGVKFRMFNRLINGGIEPCCDVLVKCSEGDIPFQSANDAARIICGLMIIENLSSRMEKWVPIFIDNAESVVSVFSDFKGQIIRLIVDSEYKTLTMTEE